MSDLEIKNTLDAVNKQLKKANEELLPKAENALKKAEKSEELSAQTKNELDKLMTTTNALEVAKNDLEVRIGEAEQLFARHKGDAGNKTYQTAGQIVANHEGLPQFVEGIQAGQKIRIPVGNAITSPDIPDGIIAPTRLPGIDQKPKQRLFIRDLIAPGQTDSNAIFWVQEGGFTNNAAAVPENTQKPYSTMTFDTKITPVATIAHMFKASKQVLDDFKQLMSTIDAEMRFGLKQKEEEQILFGNGSGANLHGIMPQAEDFNALIKPEGTSTNIDVVRLAMLQCRLARMPATGTVMDFLEWAKIELTKNSLGNDIIANPMGFLEKTLWGLPVVDTDEPNFKGKFLTGAFASGAQIFDREEANVVISTENVDDFEKNMISVRCEERLALALKRPEAFVKGEFAAAVAGLNAGA